MCTKKLYMSINSRVMMLWWIAFQAAHFILSFYVMPSGELRWIVVVVCWNFTYVHQADYYSKRAPHERPIQLFYFMTNRRRRRRRRGRERGRTLTVTAAAAATGRQPPKRPREGATHKSGRTKRRRNTRKPNPTNTTETPHFYFNTHARACTPDCNQNSSRRRSVGEQNDERTSS